IKTQKELLEFRAKQEKALADDLRSSLEAEKSRNSELVSKLNEQRSNCLRLEKALVSLEEKLSQLRQASIEDKKQIENYVEAYEKEKSHSQTLLKALESERSSFTQLQLVLESERRRSKTVHEHDSQIIQDLKKSMNSSEGGKFSPMSTPCDVEKLRGADVNRSLGLDLSNTLHLQATPVEESKYTEKPCIRCNTLEMEHALWVQEQSKLQQSLHQAESEVVRLRRLLQTVGEENNKSTLTSLESKVHKLYFKYRRAESYRRGLIYQKKYLMTLLGGYQATESATLVMLSKISGDEVTANHRSSLPPISIFRSAVYVITALQRMKNLMNRWNKVTNVHSSYSLQEPERLTPLGSHCRSTVPHGIGLPTSSVGASSSSITSQPTFQAGNQNRLFTSKLHSPLSGHSPLPLPTPTGSRSISPPVSTGQTSGSSRLVNNVYVTPPVRERSSSFAR
ncbi:pericentrin-like, partial [Limulus polyphemus]|uniref:Pericentrin-like n=1 Tax=Limulus polyphemus TaxID=6850 RepID=A0ABM1BII0_LIMPO